MTDKVVKSEQTGETYGRNKKRHSQKPSVTEEGSEDSASVNEDSLLAAADKLILDIDDAIRPVARKGEVSDNAKSATTIHLKCSPGEQNSRLEAFDGTGKVDLDAVEKWASAPSLDIHFNKKIKENADSVTHNDDRERVPDKLHKADTAVAEINGIIKTVSVTVNNSKKSLKQPYFTSQSTSAKKSNTATAHPTILSLATSKCSSSLPEILPTTHCAKPLQSIRLPPVKTASRPSKDIFHRKLEDMSLLHIPHRLPKQHPPNHQAISKVKSSSDVKEKVKYSNCVSKTNAPDQAYAARNYSQYLLPGQVISVAERSSEEELNRVVEVRNIVLDYSSMKTAKTQMKNDNRCGVLKLCTRLCCCRAQTYEADDLEQENIDTTNEKKKRSLPVRMWKRVKRCFGF